MNAHFLATARDPSVRPQPRRPGRHVRNRRLADALGRWAFCSLTTSPGAHTYYGQLRARGKTYRQALRQLANLWVGILHACLQRGQLYDETTAWQHLHAAAAA